MQSITERIIKWQEKKKDAQARLNEMYSCLNAIAGQWGREDERKEIKQAMTHQRRRVRTANSMIKDLRNATF